MPAKKCLRTLTMSLAFVGMARSYKNERPNVRHKDQHLDASTVWHTTTINFIALFILDRGIRQP